MPSFDQQRLKGSPEKRVRPVVHARLGKGKKRFVPVLKGSLSRRPVGFVYRQMVRQPVKGSLSWRFVGRRSTSGFGQLKPRFGHLTTKGSPMVRGMGLGSSGNEGSVPSRFTQNQRAHHRPSSGSPHPTSTPPSSADPRQPPAVLVVATLAQLSTKTHLNPPPNHLEFILKPPLGDLKVLELREEARRLETTINSSNHHHQRCLLAGASFRRREPTITPELLNRSRNSVTGDCDPARSSCRRAPVLDGRAGVRQIGIRDSGYCELVPTAHTTLVIRQTLTLILAMKIMARRRGGRGNAGGRGNINLAPVELNALINERLSDIVRQTVWPSRLDIDQALLVIIALRCQNHNTDVASHIQFRYGWRLNTLGCSAVYNGALKPTGGRSGDIYGGPVHSIPHLTITLLALSNCNRDQLCVSAREPKRKWTWASPFSDEQPLRPYTAKVTNQPSGCPLVPATMIMAGWFKMCGWRLHVMAAMGGSCFRDLSTLGLPTTKDHHQRWWC
ncbi:hypothetical protein E3N88_12060 [Mikania micrantha]|uniref:Uncharacterized protein n=1 Tax=Mikania micrantha TaxID=192012 RepID=A0A5N6P667_9ASTR|nr:hypothetical protein E3N88_12060 [Mikania micrantha]